MSDDFWRDFLIGLSGSFAGALSNRKPLSKIGFGELIKHLIVGTMAAVVIGPVIADKIGYDAAVIWFTGVCGMVICQYAIRLADTWFGVMDKRMKND